MKDGIEGAIKALTAKVVESGCESGDALRYSQAALNLAHTAQLMAGLRMVGGE